MKRIAMPLRIHFNLIKARQKEEHFFHLRVTRVREVMDQSEGEREYQGGFWAETRAN